MLWCWKVLSTVRKGTKCWIGWDTFSCWHYFFQVIIFIGPSGTRRWKMLPLNGDTAKWVKDMLSIERYKEFLARFSALGWVNFSFKSHHHLQVGFLQARSLILLVNIVSEDSQRLWVLRNLEKSMLVFNMNFEFGVHSWILDHHFIQTPVGPWGFHSRHIPHTKCLNISTTTW